MEIILASASPQRKALLEGLGVAFRIVVPSVDESTYPERDPTKRARELARLKAQSVRSVNPEAVVIGADTLVVAEDGTLLEKPANEAEAREMLRKHSGTVSVVHSAVAVVGKDGELREGLDSSSVHFKQFSESEIEWWIQSGLWQGRSGGFQIDGLGQLMITRIEGDWTGVVGLPVFLLGRLMREAIGEGWNMKNR
jgi:septum formation protein